MYANFIVKNSVINTLIFFPHKLCFLFQMIKSQAVLCSYFQNYYSYATVTQLHNRLNKRFFLGNVFFLIFSKI